jgi:hypothetical protein
VLGNCGHGKGRRRIALNGPIEPYVIPISGSQDVSSKLRCRPRTAGGHIPVLVIESGGQVDERFGTIYEEIRW